MFLASLFGCVRLLCHRTSNQHAWIPRLPLLVPLSCLSVPLTPSGSRWLDDSILAACPFRPVSFQPTGCCRLSLVWQPANCPTEARRRGRIWGLAGENPLPLQAASHHHRCETHSDNPTPSAGCLPSTATLPVHCPFLPRPPAFLPPSGPLSFSHSPILVFFSAALPRRPESPFPQFRSNTTPTHTGSSIIQSSSA